MNSWPIFSFFKNLLYRLPLNVAEMYKGKFLVWQLIAFAATYIIVTFNIDSTYFQATRNPAFFGIAMPAIILGGLLPIFLPLAILAIGALRRSPSLLNIGYALGQSALLGCIISSIYKSFTGRIPPTLGVMATDISHGFQFGFMRGGVFWGWPSSHTTIAFAMMVTLVVLFWNRGRATNIMCVIFMLYAIYVGLSVSVSIHWLSEFVAGAIIGTVIGMVIGKTFKKRPVDNS